MLLFIVPGHTPASADAPAACSTYLLMGARGTLELPQANGAPLTPTDYISPQKGIGVVAFKVLQQLQPLISDADETIESYGVHYNADFDPLRMGGGIANGNFLFDSGLERAWSEGVEIGTTDAVAKMNAVNGTCPNTQFILVGYSQGADVIAEAIGAVEPEVRAMIAATALFADARFRPSDDAADRGTYLSDHVGIFGGRPEWSTKISSPVFSYCHYWDFICQANISIDQGTGLGVFDVRQAIAANEQYGDVLGSHALYQKDDSAERAATEIADALLLDSSSITQDSVDVVLLLDTTAETSGGIDDLKLESGQITSSVLDASENARFAVVEYKGHDLQNPINQGINDFVTRVSSGFDADPAEVDDAVGRIVSGGGTPVPLNYAPQAAGYSGVMAAAALDWRPYARKLIVTLSGNRVGDQDPHGVEEGTTLVEQDVRAALAAEWDLSMLTVNWDEQLTAGLWNSSLGKSVVIGHNASAVDKLLEVTEQGVRTPEAIVTGPVTATAGVPVVFTSSGSRSVVTDGDQVVAWQPCEINPNPATASRGVPSAEPSAEDDLSYCEFYNDASPPSVPQVDQGESQTLMFAHPGTYRVRAWVTSDGTSDQFWDLGSTTIVVRPPAEYRPSGFALTKTLTGSTLSLDASFDDPETAEPVSYWELRDPTGTPAARYLMPEGNVSVTVAGAASTQWTLVPVNELGETAPTQIAELPIVTSAVLTHETQDNDATLVLHGETTPALEAVRTSQPIGPVSLAGNYTSAIATNSGQLINFPMNTADAAIDIGITEWTATFNFHQDTDENSYPIGQNLASGAGTSLLDGGGITAEIVGAPYRFQLTEDTETSELNVGVLDPTAAPPPGLTTVINSVSSWGPEISVRHDGEYSTDHFPAWAETPDPSSYDWTDAEISDIRAYIGTVEYTFNADLWIDSVGDPGSTGSGIYLTVYGSPGPGTDEILRQFVQSGTISFRINNGAENVITLNATSTDAEIYWPSP